MKHKIRFAGLLFVLCSPILALSACNNPSSSEVQEIMGVVISGPKTVMVGEEIPLICDVQGSDDDSVTWESLNNDIATVSETGRVKGIKQGIATIKATSKENNEISATYEVTVTLKKANTVTLKVQGDNTIQYDEAKKMWNIPLGKTCLVDYELPLNTKAPDSIAFELVFENSGSSQENAFKIELVQNENGKSVGEIHTFGVVSNVTVVFKGYYEGDQANNPSLTASAFFTVIDVNAPMKEKFDGYITSFAQKEKDSFISGQFKMTRSEDQTVVLEDTLDLHSYKNATYASRTIKNGTQETKLNYFNGLDETKNKYFHFSYDDDELIQEVYSNSNSNEANQAKAQSPYILRNDLPIYGLSTILSNYFSEDFNDGLHNFANIYCYANTTFDFKEDLITIHSSYEVESSNQNFVTELKVNLDENDMISSFVLEVSTTENNKKVTYKEELSSLQFGTRTSDSSDNSLHIDLSKYYINSFILREIAGEKDPLDRWNYLDTSKYGSQSTTTINGKTKYILSANKTLVLRVDQLVPTTSNVLIETISVTSTKSEIVPAPAQTGDGNFAISPFQSQDGKFATGESELTFTSLGGGSVTIIVEFTEIELTGINVDGISTTLDGIRVGDMTSAFRLNPIPDDLKWNFDVEIIEGPSNGISLYAWQDGSWQGYSNGSYSIEAHKAGTYKFKFFIKEKPDVKTQAVYTLVVQEALSNEEVKSQIIGKTYELRDIANNIAKGITFDSEIQLTYYEESNGTRLNQKISYKIENGQVLVSEDQNTGANFYYSRIKGERITFNEEFSTLHLIVSRIERDPATQEVISEGIERIEMKLSVVINNYQEYINGKTFYSTSGIYQVSINLKDSKGKIEIVNQNTLETLCTITFDYTYVPAKGNSDAEYQLSNIQYSNSGWTLNSTIPFGTYTHRLVVKFSNSIISQVSFTIE